MIDIELTNQEIDVKTFTDKSSGEIVPESYPMLFFGTVICNEYDNQRVKLSKQYDPKSFLHAFKAIFNDENADDLKCVSILPLRGIILKPNDVVKSLVKLITDQEKNGINLKTYQNILSQFNMTCNDTYHGFGLGAYPIDFINLKSVSDDEFKNDKKIFQHLLGLNEKGFDFQRYTSLKLFILTLGSKVFANVDTPDK